VTNRWGYGQISASPDDQYTLAPWIGQSNDLTSALHRPPNPEGLTKQGIALTQPQAQVTTTKSRQDSSRHSLGREKGYSPLDWQAYQAYHREIGMRNRKKDREKRERMEAATRHLEQVHASLMARETALMEEAPTARPNLGVTGGLFD
jgi:hypothetical protein